jgi:hypothetical protein
MRGIGIARRRPPSGLGDAPGALTACLDHPTGCGLISILVRKPFLPLELPGWPFAPCLLHDSSGEDVLQLLIHLAHPIGRGCMQCVQEHSHNGHILVGHGEGGKLPLLTVGRCGLLCFERKLALV